MSAAIAAEGTARRAEERRHAATALVVSCYRLARAVQLHGDANQAVQAAIVPVIEAVQVFCSLQGVDQAKLLFTRDLVFVNRRIVRASRETYALALQLGALLEHAELNEMAIEAKVSEAALLEVMRALVDAQRDRSVAQRLVSASFRGVSLRRAPNPDEDVSDQTSESPLARLVKAYASSLLVLRSFHEDAQQGAIRRAHEVKRIAQKLVALHDEQPELLVATAAGRFVDAGVARRALSSAVVAIAMVRELGGDRDVAGVVALAALTTDVGALRLPLGADPRRVPASGLLAATLAGGLHPSAVQREVVVHEALGGADDPTLPAAILGVARRWNDLRAPSSSAKGLSVGEAVARLEATAETERDRALVRLLVAALGFYPLRTVVELDTGEVAVVTGCPANAIDFARPPVQILTDASQALREHALDVDLARPPRGERPRRIARALTLGRPPVPRASSRPTPVS